MIKKSILIIIAIAGASAGGYYTYLNLFKNRYELTYELKRSPDSDAKSYVHTFLAKNDSIAAEKAVDWLMISFDTDNYLLTESKYIYHYNNLRLNNVTKDTLVRVPAALIKERCLADYALETSRFDMREVDWLMFADHIPFFTYNMTVWLDNPYEDKHLRFIADNDYEAVNKAVDTLAYYIGNRWCFENRPVEDVLVANTYTLEFARSNAWMAWNRLRNHPYCDGISFNSYSVKIRGLVDEGNYRAPY